MLELFPPLVSPTPEAYLKSGLEAVLPPEELRQNILNISSKFRGANKEEIYTSPCVEEERIALESILKFIDMCLPRKEGEYGSRATNPYVRYCKAVAMEILDFGFTDVDLEDIRQEVRIATLFTLRRRNPKNKTSPLSAVVGAIGSKITRVGAQALNYGFATSRSPTIEDHYSVLRNRAFSSSSEFGMSDHFDKLNNHPYHVSTEPLEYVPENLEDEEKDRVSIRLPTDFQPLVPDHDKVDCRDITLQEDVDNLEQQTLERIFSTIELTSMVFLSDKEKQILRLYYQDSLTFEQIGIEFKVKRQRIHQIYKKALAKIQTSPGAMAALEDLTI